MAKKVVDLQVLAAEERALREQKLHMQEACSMFLNMLIAQNVVENEHIFEVLNDAAQIKGYSLRLKKTADKVVGFRFRRRGHE